jgi:hypothetical protein
MIVLFHDHVNRKFKQHVTWIAALFELVCMMYGPVPPPLCGTDVDNKTDMRAGGGAYHYP